MGLLALMGSGETSPTMVRIHRELVERLGVRSPQAVLLDAPYAFQENVAGISANAQRYFRESVGLTVSVVSELSGFPDAGIAALRTADWVFSGPGSPSYALRCWHDGPYERALRERVRTGIGVTLFASAAAATAGAVTLPVYEVYKVGADPHWLPGLDLLGELDLPVALIPHYDNNEGRNHDTRYCYLGERRLAVLEKELPDDAAVVGIDEHTAALIDLETSVVEVLGKGGLTVRRAGRSTVLPSGTTLSLDELRQLLREARSAVPAATGPVSSTTVAESPESFTLMELTAECEVRFEAALSERDASAMTRAILDLESAIREWAADTEEDEGTNQAADALRSMIVRLGSVADKGIRDPRTVFGPIVEPLVAVRRQLREDSLWEYADQVRDALAAGGIELRDGPDGTEWHLQTADPLH
ncbi:Type 1 glutamine amidotransferase-like domain-containing protein [Tenggerimyces flavus]|uniref:Type 1 glutamine amidotransferase-like domain-containing protein n=1 Tax=Tenggerimyces flavus TaxID=1708749 RepID=A0ABV7YBP2_9ACTN|nr:Type 1 glutamine amidotransferase-like domain-containing protein [Tenggerimyces flavus]MBM7789050.1 cyanophycinase-like exopeptidase [Tenggerimyces flavus]